MWRKAKLWLNIQIWLRSLVKSETHFTGYWIQWICMFYERHCTCKLHAANMIQMYVLFEKACTVKNRINTLSACILWGFRRNVKVQNIFSASKYQCTVANLSAKKISRKQVKWTCICIYVWKTVFEKLRDFKVLKHFDEEDWTTTTIL